MIRVLDINCVYSLLLQILLQNIDCLDFQWIDKKIGDNIIDIYMAVFPCVIKIGIEYLYIQIYTVYT